MSMIRIGDIVTINLRGHPLHEKTGKVVKVEIVSGEQMVVAEIEMNGGVAGYYGFKLPIPPTKPKLKWRV